MSKYLDKEGLIYLWSKIKTLIDSKTYSVATSSENGLMSASDKATLDAIPNTYAKKTDLSSVYKYQGSVANYASLPASSTVGYVYNVESDGHNYAWTGTEWDNLGGTLTIESITNSEIDTIMSS